MLTGTELKDRRQLIGMSQEALAQEIGVDQGTISRWERDEAIPSGPAQKMLEIVIAKKEKIIKKREAAE